VYKSFLLLCARKKFWLWPIIVMMALLGVLIVLIVLAQGSAVTTII
jgi:hypothetical protein